jgi:serine/threonine protein kinase
MSEHESGGALIGVVLANSYEVTRFIGRGGMGAVYEGRHMRLGQRVAIKIMAGDLAANGEALARFRREAEVTSRIRHPHIVHVFDFGSTRTGEPFLVMEHLDGEDLERRLARVGRFSVAATVHIIKQASAALGAAHAKGIVHRDLKPANVFLLELEGEADFVKVVDFGISKVKAAATKLTQSAVIMGTPSYMSPEQARGRVDEIDHHTDQWALGAMAYEMLSGRVPFAGEDVASVLYQVTREEPLALSEMVPGLPLAIERVVHRTLAKRPADRFGSVAAFSRALDEAAKGHEQTREWRGQRPPSIVSASATVAYGTKGPYAEPEALRGPPGEDGDATVISGPPAMTGQDARGTTFSHATGESRVRRRWNRVVRERRRLAVGGAGLAMGVAIWVMIDWARQLRPGPGDETVSATAAAGLRARTAAPPHVVISSMRSPPLFVGPPLPPLEELARAQAAAAARSQRSRDERPALDPLGRLANPFEDEDDARRSDRRRGTTPLRAEPTR